MQGRNDTVSATQERRSQAERSRTTRRVLIDATIAALNEFGFSGATAVVIGEKARLTRGALQHHFGTMQELFIDVMRHVSRSRASEVDASLQSSDQIGDRMEFLINEYRLLYDSPEGIALMEIWLGSGHDEVLRQKVDKLLQKIAETRVDRWKSVLSDLSLTKSEIVTLRGLTVSTLRGAAIHRVFSRDPKQAEAQVRLFLEMTEKWLSGRGARSSASSGRREK